ncbi:MAG TPA: SdrD B-like domain-containing protein, partial [Pyrinomonadaceae bacterium]|nr:SdrD B-like domain-containing protein [Pyrinomonadaceae bacterium]
MFSDKIYAQKVSKTVKNQDTKHLIGNVSGKVFNDVSGNGKLNPNELGVANVTITVFDVSGNLQGTITTDTDGNYSLNVGGTGPYRVEFSDFPAGFLPAKHSITSGINSLRTSENSGTSVQFIANGNTSNVNFALFNPSMVGTVPPVGTSDILQNGYTIYSQASDSNGNTLFVRDITQLGTLW